MRRYKKYTKFGKVIFTVNYSKRQVPSPLPALYLFLGIAERIETAYLCNCNNYKFKSIYKLNKTSKIMNVDGYPHMYRHYFCTLLKSKYSCSDEFVRTVVRWQSNDLVNLYNDNYD